MTVRLRRPAALIAGCMTLALTASPAAARPVIPEEQVVNQPGRQLIRIRIPSGCGDAPTDRIEVRIPDSVVGVLPEAQAGWNVRTVVESTEPYDLFGAEQTERVSAVRWTGGSLPSSQFLDFGIVAVVTEEGRHFFPVIESCGANEVRWVDEYGPDEQPSAAGRPAAVLTVVSSDSVVDPAALQSTVADMEQTIQDLEDEVQRLRHELQEVRQRLDDAGADEDGNAQRS